MTRPPTEGFQKPLHRGPRKGVGLALITEADLSTVCSCGWVSIHPRKKVRANAAQRHTDKAHNGRAVWL